MFLLELIGRIYQSAIHSVQVSSVGRQVVLEAAQRRLVQFRNNWHEATGVLLSWDLAIIYWVERQRSRTKSPISNSSALEYVGRAQAALRRTGASSVGGQMLIDYVRALKRAGALRPQKQAIPAVGEQVLGALRKEVDGDTQLAIVLCWAGAARVSDVVRLKVGDITFEDGYVAVNWSETKSDLRVKIAN